ncbi:hypothetical protein AMATHDRAFT_143451 [Amanita thiersii Skay4041]|uniref:CNH domain-containing protein n=1 Tax=Amanita thiersii Skay4041 TaxID=703135 RepID=A0A2A9NLV3_9AGAR|nr:hypothetical protein AMATHDRAFT_143451 [Amanita thiersii Skay4041]
MAPFDLPKVVLSGFKEKIDSLVVQDDRVYIGTSAGSLHVYGLQVDGSVVENDNGHRMQLVEVKKSLTRRSIEQLGFIKVVNSLVVLSEATVTLFPLPTFSPPTPLVKAKGVLSFAVYSCVRRVDVPDTSGGDDSKVVGSAGSFQAESVKSQMSRSPPMLITLLLVGCRRKVVLYSWRDGEAQEAKEVSLSHSPRAITFVDHETACFAYTSTEHAIFNISTMTATDVTTPSLIAAAASTGMSALTGLSGYMSLGFGAKTKPCVVSIDETEALVVKDNQGIFVGREAKASRLGYVDWPAPPEETVFIKPYLFSVLPAGTVASSALEGSSPSVNTAQSYIPTTVLQIRSSFTLQPVQTTSYPFSDTNGSHALSPIQTNSNQNATIRLLTPSYHIKPHLFIVTTPMDRNAAAAEGSTIWQMSMKSWTEQLDELVMAGQYADALTLLDVIDDVSLPDKEQKRQEIRVLNAVAQFRASKYDTAIDIFTELDVNPAKVVALYPESVAGRLSVSAHRWIPLFGGPEPLPLPPPQAQDEDSSSVSSSHKEDKGKSAPQVETGADAAADTRSLVDRLPGLSSAKMRLLQSDTASIISQRRGSEDEFHRSVETLVRYLSDRRPKIGAALQALGITPQNQSHQIAPLSEAPVEELFALPNARLSALTPEQLLRFAQIVDTALYKSYLIIRPVLLGSLCRVPNWCEVTEVEEDLRSRHKFGELRDLYFGKKMHGRALSLLKDLSETEDDIQDKLWPTIAYLQKLGPEHLDQIFLTARWVFEVDQDMAFEIFTSEDVELPRQAVADYLESIDPLICAKYLEFLIAERHEHVPEYHDRLAVTYLDMTLAAKKRNDDESRRENYKKLLAFIDTDNYYTIARLYSLLASTELHEAKAILLGRLGRHDQALELYVYRLRDFSKAEEYCNRIYVPDTETSNVFLTLLHIYLRPTVKTDMDLLHPALELISRHTPHLDPVETLQLLPPLVTTRDVKKFLIEAMRAPLFDTKVVREISKTRNDTVSRRLMGLQMQRVKVTDVRICPQCHKRIGNSVIAVHAPCGEVTHYQCREAFSKKLHELRS